MDTPCMFWPGTHRASDGRPVIGDRYVYRIVYEQVKGPLLQEQVLHHLCHDVRCINPEHLVPLLQGEHMREHGLTGGDWGQAAKTHCPVGHAYTDENTYRWRNERQCKTCRRAAKLRYLAKYREAHR